VRYRRLRKDSSAVATTYSITRPSGDSNESLHSKATLDDPDGKSRKIWTFETAAGFNRGLVKQYDEQHLLTTRRRQEYTWSQDPAGRLYTSAVVTSLEPGTTQQRKSRQTQTLDEYGNVTEAVQYGFGAAGTGGTWGAEVRRQTAVFVSSQLSNQTSLTQCANGGAILPEQMAAGGGPVYRARYVNNLPLYTLASGPFISVGTCYYYDWNLSGFGGYGEWTDPNSAARGNLREVRTLLGGAFSWPRRILYVDPTGNVTNSSLMVVGGSSSITESISYSMNNTVPAVITPMNNAALKTEVLSYEKFLAPKYVREPNWAESFATYENARPKTRTSALGAVTTYTYNDTVAPRSMTELTGQRWTKTTYDGLGRPVKVETGDGGLGGPTKSIVETEYDSCGCSPLGKVKKVSLPYAPNATKYWTEYEYDGLARRLTVKQPNNSGTSPTAMRRIR
jgi:hypothetical protein